MLRATHWTDHGVPPRARARALAAAGPAEVAIRAAAVAAQDQLAEALQHAVTPHELGCWLKSLVEEGQGLAGVQLHPHLTRGTAAY